MTSPSFPWALPSAGDVGPSSQRRTLHTTVAEREVEEKATVLLVDDFEPVRTLMARYLERLGFRMLAASDAEQAIRTLDSEEIDHVLLDVNLPGGSRSVYDHIHRKRNGLLERTAFITGGFIDGASETFVRGTGCPALLKPFDLAALKNILHR